MEEEEERRMIGQSDILFFFLGCGGDMKFIGRRRRNRRWKMKEA